MASKAFIVTSFLLAVAVLTMMSSEVAFAGSSFPEFQKTTAKAEATEGSDQKVGTVRAVIHQRFCDLRPCKGDCCRCISGKCLQCC